MRRYLETILTCLARGYSIDPGALSVEFLFESAPLPLDCAVTLGMIANEIIGYAIGDCDIRYLSIAHQRRDRRQELILRHSGSDIFGPVREAGTGYGSTQDGDTRAMVCRIVEIPARRPDASFDHDEREGACYTILTGGQE